MNLNIIDSIITSVVWILILIVVLLICYGIYFMVKFKHKIIIKDCVNSRKIVGIKRFKEFTAKDGVIWWKVFGEKNNLVPNPRETIDVSDKGKMIAYVYKLDGDTYVPAKDTFEIPKNNTEKDQFLKGFGAYPTNQRALMVSQHEKAERNRKKSIGELLTVAMPYIAIIMILAIFMIFFSEVTKPTIEAGQTWTAISNNMVKVTERLDVLINNRPIDYWNVSETVLPGGVMPR